MMKAQLYSDLLRQAQAITEGESNLIANLSNISALLYDAIDDINWLGFYLAESSEELVLGPFQGKVACVRISFGKGVCGVGAKTQQTQCVKNVHEFEGHIACDSASNSEVVAPIVVNGKTVAVLDIDSPSIGRFDNEDAAGFQRIADFCSNLNWQK